MSKRTISMCLALAGLALGATPAAAQERTIDRYGRELAVKYSPATEESYDWASTGLIFDGGFKVCGSGSWNCQVIGELSFHRFPDFRSGNSHQHTQVSGGLRVGGLVGARTRPFVQFLVGMQRCCDENVPVYQVGGGVNIALSDGLDLQLQADLPYAKYPGSYFRQFRLGFGIGIPLGPR